MGHSVKLNELAAVLSELDYPTTRKTVIEELGGTIVRYADGEERLGNVVSRSTAEEYADPDELDSEIRSNLAIEAVGEPGQSEGDG